MFTTNTISYNTTTEQLSFGAEFPKNFASPISAKSFSSVLKRWISDSDMPEELNTYRFREVDGMDKISIDEFVASGKDLSVYAQGFVDKYEADVALLYTTSEFVQISGGDNTMFRCKRTAFEDGALTYDFAEYDQILVNDKAINIPIMFGRFSVFSETDKFIIRPTNIVSLNDTVKKLKKSNLFSDLSEFKRKSITHLLSSYGFTISGYWGIDSREFISEKLAKMVSAIVVVNGYLMDMKHPVSASRSKRKAVFSAAANAECDSSERVRRIGNTSGKHRHYNTNDDRTIVYSVESWHRKGHLRHLKNGKVIEIKPQLCHRTCVDTPENEKAKAKAFNRITTKFNLE